LDEYKTPEKDYWVEAVNTACHAINRLNLHKIMKKTAYELLIGKMPKVKYFRVFGCKCFILNKKSKSSKFAPRVDEGFLLGYGTNEHGYHVFNKTTGQTEIVIDVTFDESDGSQKEQVNVEIVGKEEPSYQVIKKLATGELKSVEKDDDDDAQKQVNHDPHMHHGSTDVHGDASTSRSDRGSREQANQDSPQVEDGNQDDDKTRSNEDSPSVNQDYDSEDDGPIQARSKVPHPRAHQSIQRDHPIDTILGSIQRGVMTRSRLATFCEHCSFVSSKLPLRVEDALKIPDWVMATQEELNNFTRNEV
jgi:hypothetical protein